MPVTEAIFVKCIVFLADKGIGAWKRSQVISKAISDTCQHFEQRGLPSDASKSLSANLKKWSESDEILTLTSRFSQEGASLGQDAAVESYKNVVRTLQGNLTFEEIVEQFLLQLAVQFELVDPAAAKHGEFSRNAAVMDSVGNLTAMFADLRDEIRPKTLQLPPEDQDKRTTEDAIWHSKIDTAIQHYKNGKVALAKSLTVETLDAVQLKPVSPYLKFRTYSTLGNCHLALEQFEDARSSFQSALDTGNHRHLAWANLASAHLLLGNFIGTLDAVSQARTIEDANPLSTAIFIQALFKNGKTSELEDFISQQQWVLGDHLCLMALAQNSFDANEFESAVELFKQSIDKNPYDPQLFELLCQSYYRYVQDATRGNTPLDGKWGPKILLYLDELLSAAEDALRLMTNWDEKTRSIHVLNMASSACFLKQDVTKALSYAEQILVFDPDHQTAKFKTATILMLQNRNLEEAITKLESLNGWVADGACLLMAELYLRLNKSDKASLKLDHFKTIPNRESMLIVYARLRLELGEQIGESLDQATKALREEYSDNADVLLAIAQKLRSVGRRVDALEILREAYSKSQNTVGQYIDREEAQIYFDSRRWNAAWKKYETFIDKNDNSQDLYEYIVANANGGGLPSAYHWAKKARLREGKPIPVITDIEITYLKKYYTEEEWGPLKQDLDKSPKATS